MTHETDITQTRARLDAMFRDLCCNDESAVHVCWSVFQFVHVLDDLVDRDKEVAVETVGLSFIILLETVAANPFFQQQIGRAHV